MKKLCLLLIFSCLFLLGGGCSPKKESVLADDSIETGQGTLLPAEVIDLTNWKVTLPIDTDQDGRADEIKQPQLATYRHATYFDTSSTNDYVKFRAHCGGVTTPNSSYPRTELREMKNNGLDQASWSTTSGTHTMSMRQRVLKLPPNRPHVITAQIHDADALIVAFRLEDTRLYVQRQGESKVLVDANYTLGTWYNLKIEAQGGRIKVWYNDDLVVDWEKSATGCYFKAGCYTQSNTSYNAPDAYAEVCIKNLKVEHK